MKKVKHFITVMALMALTAGADASAQEPQQGSFPIIEGGVGPAISGSVEYTQIPLEARKFIDRHFKGLTVTEAEREFADGTYDIELSDGTDIEFNSKGEWTEVDAPEGRLLSDKLLRHLLPDRARRDLGRYKVYDKVEAVKRTSSGYTVELRGMKVDEYLFDHSGRFLGATD